MKNSEDEYRVMVDEVPALLWRNLPDGTNEFLNQRWHDYTGLSPQEAHGWDGRSRFTPRTWGSYWKSGRKSWLLGSRVKSKRACDVSTENIDGSSSARFPTVGSSKALRQVLGQVAKVAPTDSTVLISGETGTGKELIARAVHKRSNRSARAFIRVNCAAISPSLIASELFGHEKGAFTGALQRRIGRFEAADGGTIFLDEIGDLPMETQVALLRVLQEREFERVRSSQPLAVDVRVLAATNRDLKFVVDTGSLRQDLFLQTQCISNSSAIVT